MANVLFIQGTQAQYEALTPKVETTFYYIDGKDLYLGSKKITNAADLDAVEALIGDLNNLDTTAKDTLVNAINELKAASDANVIKIEAAATPTDGYLKTYVVTQGTTEIGKIDIPKDLVVTGGEVVDLADGEVAGVDAGKYIKLTIANQEAPLYIAVSDLVDAYTPAAGATQVQIAISATNEVSATLVAGGVTATELAADAVETTKIKDANVTAAKLADDAKELFIGTASDLSSADTINGAKKYAEEKAAAATLVWGTME